MISSIKKYSKSIFFKILVGIIILPFVFWGMGDVFRGGSQNVVAKIESEKISTQEFVNYLRILNLSESQIKNFPKTNLIENILSDYIGKKVLNLELENLKVVLSDSSLKKIIMNDKTFFKDNKFSRTEYEKFLITSNLSAPLFENNIAEQEKKRQLLSYLSDGMKIPNFLVQSEYNKNNQKRFLDYIDLKDYYNKEISQKEIEKTYKENQAFFNETFKTIRLVELKPINLIGNEDYSENFFKKINEIENKVLDNISLDQFKIDYNLSIKNIGSINKDFKDIKGNNILSTDKKVLKRIFQIEELKSVELINISEKFYLAEITEEIIKKKDLNDSKVKKTIKKQVMIKKKIEGNSLLAKEISTKKFNNDQMKIFAEKNNLVIKSTVINNLEDNEIFSSGVLKRIFETTDNEINLITDNMLEDNFIIYSKKTELSKISKSDPEYKNFKLKAKLNMANNIYNSYDLSLNNKYNVEINNKVLDRIKNSF